MYRHTVTFHNMFTGAIAAIVTCGIFLYFIGNYCYKGCSKSCPCSSCRPKTSIKVVDVNGINITPSSSSSSAKLFSLVPSEPSSKPSSTIIFAQPLKPTSSLTSKLTRSHFESHSQPFQLLQAHDSEHKKEVDNIIAEKEDGKTEEASLTNTITQVDRSERHVEVMLRGCSNIQSTPPQSDSKDDLNGHDKTARKIKYRSKMKDSDQQLSFNDKVHDKGRGEGDLTASGRVGIPLHVDHHVNNSVLVSSTSPAGISSSPSAPSPNVVGKLPPLQGKRRIRKKI